MSWILGIMWLALGFIFIAGNDWGPSVAAWFAFGVANFYFATALIINAIGKAGKK